MLSPRPALALAATFALVGSSTAADKFTYNRDIRSILAENCFACHGPDSAARKAKLRLDDRAVAVGKGAITPGKVDESELVSRLFLDDADEQLMPPASSHKKLTPAQKETLKKWVADGAVYESHWAFIPPGRVAVPAVKGAKWVRTPVDAFVLAELEKRGLTPNPEADRRTLARRAAFDAIGLPPAPADVEAFVADKSPDAYEKYLDKLLASPHWGEHRGRYWLDAARYGDTHGIHFDNYREVWAYRDWVINAFNKNQPFDDFTRDQLAGDLRANPTLDQLVATGFNRNNITTNEGGAINEEYLVLYTRDRTDAASTIWLGLTAGCAVCHDHKFDPISQKEFYGLAAFFNNSTQAAMDGNIKDTPPIVFVPAAADRAAWGAFKAKLTAADARVAAAKASARPGFDAWLKTARADTLAALVSTEKLVLDLPLDKADGGAVAGLVNGRPVPFKLPAEAEFKPGAPGGKGLLLKPAAGTVSVPNVGDFDGGEAFSYGAWVQVPNRGQSAAVLAKMDVANGHRGWDLWLDNDRVSAHIISDWPTDAIKVTTKTTVNVNGWHHLFVTYDGSKAAAGVKIYIDGELQPTEAASDAGKLTGTTRTTAPVTLGRRTPAEGLRAVALADVRIYGRALGGTEVGQLALSGQAAGVLAKPAAKRTPKELDSLFNGYLTLNDAPYKAAAAALQAMKGEEVGFRGRGTVAAVMNEKPTPPEAYILFRGEYDQRRDKVSPHTPKALPAMPADLPRNRLGLAEWLLKPDHPLTARVTVNRFWQELFGQGLVRTAGDFGVTGEPPSHPELLDWLATEFRTGGSDIAGLGPKSAWDVKRFFKLLLLSNAYRQSAATTPAKLDADPANRLLSRGPRFRMDAEEVRDNALAAAGLLTPTLGGPSVRPYQPGGVWEAVAMKESNTSKYQSDRGANLYRRSMYTFWKRAAPPASLELFNAPNRETCTVRRDRTNTPMQALVTLNDPQFVEAARVLAENAYKSTADDAGRLDFVARRLLARPFRPEEAAIVTASLAGLTKHYQAAQADAKKLLAVGDAPSDGTLDPATLAAWTMLVNELMNLDEVLCK